MSTKSLVNFYVINIPERLRKIKQIKKEKWRKVSWLKWWQQCRIFAHGLTSNSWNSARIFLSRWRLSDLEIMSRRDSSALWGVRDCEKPLFFSASLWNHHDTTSYDIQNPMSRRMNISLLKINSRAWSGEIANRAEFKSLAVFAFESTLTMNSANFQIQHEILV